MAVSVEQLAKRVSVDAEDADIEAELTLVLAAVLGAQASRYVLPEEPTEMDQADWDLATLMTAARLWARKDSPGGVIAVGEMGPIRVSRFDADVEMLLARFEVWNFA